MTVHAFVDESQRERYMICAAVISPSDLQATRRALRGMLLPRQSRLHFVSERPKRRRSLLDAMCELPVRTRLYTSAEKEPVARQRAHTVRGVEGAYARSDLLDQRHEVIQRWAAYLAN